MQKHKKKLLWAAPIPGTLAPLVGPTFPRASVSITVVRFDSDRRMSRVTAQDNTASTAIAGIGIGPNSTRAPFWTNRTRTFSGAPV